MLSGISAAPDFPVIFKYISFHYNMRPAERQTGNRPSRGRFGPRGPFVTAPYPVRCTHPAIQNRNARRQRLPVRIFYEARLFRQRTVLLQPDSFAHPVFTPVCIKLPFRVLPPWHDLMPARKILRIFQCKHIRARTAVIARPYPRVKRQTENQPFCRNFSRSGGRIRSSQL